MNKPSVSNLDPLFEGMVPALVENMANKITQRDREIKSWKKIAERYPGNLEDRDHTIRIKDAALTTALKELGRRHAGSGECTEAIKQIREALERGPR